MTSAPRWSIEQDVRADAESIFVPVEQLADAQAGDGVEVRSPESNATHRGHITERIDDEARGEFFIVRLDEPV